jgi:hypothetical protein
MVGICAGPMPLHTAQNWFGSFWPKNIFLHSIPPLTNQISLCATFLSFLN